MSLIRTRRPAWRRWTPRQRAIGQIANALDEAASTWPLSSATRRALDRANRAVATAGRCALTEEVERPAGVRHPAGLEPGVRFANGHSQPDQ